MCKFAAIFVLVNVFTGISHANLSSGRLCHIALWVLAQIEAGLYSALTSDYNYFLLKQVGLELAKSIGLKKAWSLLSPKLTKILKLTY